MPNNHYINSDQSVFNDAQALFNLNKNILLKALQALVKHD